MSALRTPATTTWNRHRLHGHCCVACRQTYAAPSTALPRRVPVSVRVRAANRTLREIHPANRVRMEIRVRMETRARTMVDRKGIIPARVVPIRTVDREAANQVEAALLPAVRGVTPAVPAARIVPAV